ncbi:MAG: hypothetical protein MJE68_00620, partial [Proteobacteria bacterium]|nr:hypothetical protein [Pseudomonadota bacterium]
NFTMKGLGKITYNPSEEGAIHSSSVIACSCHGEKRSGILFYKSNTIVIENLTIEDCGAKFILQGPDYFPLVSALTFRESYDIRIAQIRMDRSLGFGLDADRNYGGIIVSNSAFLRNKLSDDLNIILGGNVRFWYSFYNISATEAAHIHRIRFNTTLRIEHSWFLYGTKDDREEVPSAGGLTIFIYLPNTTIIIDHIKAISNTGNVAIRISDQPKNTSAVIIRNSIIANGSAARGGGLRFWIKQNKMKFKKFLIKSLDIVVQHKLVIIQNTTFSNNSALENGGGLYISHYEGAFLNNIRRLIHIDSCQFIGSYLKSLGRSYTGVAVQIVNHKITSSIPHTTPQYFFNFVNCTFAYNKVNEITNEGGIINFASTSGIFINDSNFTSNEGTAISLRDSNVEFGGYILFKNNTARNGGALKFCQFSSMNLPLGHVLIDFVDNSATYMGGAIYVAQEQCVEALPPCFFQPVVPNTANVTPSYVNVTLRFFNNSA